jgi:serine/threonine protein kinase
VGAAVLGTKLGRYQIVKHLASGGMAEVLLARASGIEGFTRHVVIKRIRPSQANDASFVQMFLNEARLAAQLHHHHIVQVHDIGQEGNEYFFAMEYVHGEDLRRLLTHLARHKQKLPFEHVVTIITAAATALHHAHEQLGPDRKPLCIVHRDVTPANILVGYDGSVKVADFGIAKAAARTAEVTQAGTLKGKASYMSPEQCTGSATLDRRSDVFALGIVLYELATTRRLFKADNDFLTMSAIVSGMVPSPREQRSDMPISLEAIILQALAH